MKTCFKCNAVLPLSEFYTHPAMGDGHLGKCKACAKIDSTNRRSAKLMDVTWVLNEAERCRIKSRVRRSMGVQLKASPGSRRITLKKHAEMYPERNHARYMVNNAIRNGALVKKPCERCANPISQAHHEDYTKPLEIVWLCAKHHAERHVQINNERRIARLLHSKAA